MGILTVQFGQCGNQVGHALFSYLVEDIYNLDAKNADYYTTATKQWFCGTKNNFIPRTVLVDTENKVISAITKEKNLLRYRNIISKCAGGSANNWANGYVSKGAMIQEEALNMIRKEVEKSDELTNIFSILGCGGGTGSGVGSKIIEILRDEFPNKMLLNAIILPYNDGEIVTQSYNALLTLAKLYDLTDGTILFENTQLHKLCANLLKIKDVDLVHLNTLIAQKIAAILQPVVHYNSESFCNLAQLTSHPVYKFIDIKTAPHIPVEYLQFESQQNWATLILHMRNTLRENGQPWEFKMPSVSQKTYPGIRYSKSVGNLLVSRGGVSPGTQDLRPLMVEELYPNWLPSSDRFKHYHQSKKLHNTLNLLALATNCSSISAVVDTVVEQAWNLFNHNVYLHQYEQFGVNKEDFSAAFEKMESVLRSYKSLE